MDCSVCDHSDARRFCEIGERVYHRCERCRATFLDPSQLPSPQEEHQYYLLHENDPADPSYRRFLSRLAEPLLARLPARCEGLDFGCGPGPVLAQMLREAGHEISLYDPFFAPDAEALSRRYDFIVCSETAEHFHFPGREFARFDALLRPGGWLAVMTCFQTDDARFADWHYRRDPTHVVFYRAETFVHLARRHGWSCTIVRKDVALMRKAEAGTGLHRAG